MTSWNTHTHRLQKKCLFQQRNTQSVESVVLPCTRSDHFLHHRCGTVGLTKRHQHLIDKEQTLFFEQLCLCCVWIWSPQNGVPMFKEVISALLTVRKKFCSNWMNRCLKGHKPVNCFLFFQQWGNGCQCDVTCGCESDTNATSPTLGRPLNDADSLNENLDGRALAFL